MTVRKARAFTLIETLVVTAIAAILAAIAFVGIQSAVASAKTTSCVSNLHQIGTALALYGHDNDERYPPYTFQGVEKLLPQPKAFKAALKGYKVADEQFYCPLDPHARTDYQSELYSHLETSYYMSIDYYNQGKVEGSGFVFNPSSVSDPAKVNVFDDMSDLVTDADGKRTRTGPHGTRYNVLRADGSVVNIPIVQP